MDARATDPALVILAAGASTRLGTCKALVVVPGRAPATPLAHALAAGWAFAAHPPLVVTGAHHREIVHALPRGAAAARNADWERGRTGSVRVARDLRRGLDLCVAPVDVPFVPAEVFATLRDVWRAAGAPERGWLAPFRKAGSGRAHGHPIVVGRGLLEELSTLEPDESLRGLRARAAPLLEVEVRAPEITFDLDTPVDLESLRRPPG